MLHSMTLLGRLKREGRDAAHCGLKEEDAPYTSEDLRQAWIAGWKLGQSDKERIKSKERFDLSRKR